MKAHSFKIQTALLVIGLALSTTSQATPPPRGDTVWNGYYFGAYFGAGTGNVRTQFNSNEQFFVNTPDTESINQTLLLINSTIEGTLKGKVSGSAADLFFGYNFYEPSYNLVLGAQLEGSIYSDINWTTKGELNSLTTVSSLIITSEPVISLYLANIAAFDVATLDRLRSKFALIGRAGYLINPCTLIYGLGGPVAGHFVLPAAEFETLDLTDNHKNQWELGYTVGAGLEFKINDHWSLRGEYRYLSFEIDRTISGISDITTVDLGFDDSLSFAFSNRIVNQKTSAKFHDHLGEIGVVYSF